MKKIFLLAAFAFTSILFAQDKIMIIENNLAELGEFDRYNLHTYAKQYFEADGFKVYFEKDIPLELVNNRCSASFFNLLDKSGMLSTRLVMQIKDCTGKVIFTSDEGVSKEKSYVTGYRQAFFNTTKSYRLKKNMIDFNNTYNLAKIVNPISSNVPNTKIESLPNKQVSDTSSLIFEFPEGKSVGELKDKNGNVLYSINKTSVENLFTASNKYVDGIIFLKNNKWFFEFTKNGEKITDEIK